MFGAFLEQMKGETKQHQSQQVDKSAFGSNQHQVNQKYGWRSHKQYTAECIQRNLIGSIHCQTHSMLEGIVSEYNTTQTT